MEGSNTVSDLDYLNQLRLEYIEAIQLEDYPRISQVIVPRFWERFSRYYEIYASSWKSISLLRVPIQVVIDPSREREMEFEWAERVLRGQIELS